MELSTFITLSVIDSGDEDGLLRYRMVLSNGENATTLEFWQYDYAFKKFGMELSQFPLTATSKVTFQIGEEDPAAKWAYYLQLDVFCYRPNGASVIHVRVKNPDEMPRHYKSEFFLRTLPAELNRLGHQLCGWNPCEQEQLTWVPCSIDKL